MLEMSLSLSSIRADVPHSVTTCSPHSVDERLDIISLGSNTNGIQVAKSSGSREGLPQSIAFAPLTVLMAPVSGLIDPSAMGVFEAAPVRPHTFFGGAA